MRGTEVHTEVDALEAMARAHYGRLVRGLTLYAGAEAAEDAVQEGFVQALRHWKRIRLYDDPIGWVRRVAINRLLNGQRKHVPEGLATTSTAAPSVDSDLCLDVQAAIRRLPPRQRLIVSLYYLADEAVVQIAQEIGISEGTVKSTLHDARQSIGAELRGCAYG